MSIWFNNKRVGSTHATGFRFLDEVMSRIADGKISHGTLFGDILIATFKSIFNVNIQCRRFLN